MSGKGRKCTNVIKNIQNISIGRLVVKPSINSDSDVKNMLKPPLATVATLRNLI